MSAATSSAAGVLQTVGASGVSSGLATWRIVTYACAMLIARRFRGPAGSANGGYAAGRVASYVRGPAEVTLRSPPPLDVELTVDREDGGRVVVRSPERVVAEAAPVELPFEAPAPVSLADAQAATLTNPSKTDPDYSDCFVCGPARVPGDGLGIFPGAVAGREVAAAPFVAEDPTLSDDAGVVRPEIVWAALDCPSWFGVAFFYPVDGAALLGRLAGRIERRPRAGERCVCVGWFIGRDGRKIHAGSAIYAGDELCAVGRAVWIVLR